MGPEPIFASVHIDADPSEVYEYFVSADAILRWMGERAQLDPRPGGVFALEVDGAPIRGRYLELDPPHRLVISWGFLGSASLPPGSSSVEVRLRSEGVGTTVEIFHRGLPEVEAGEHVSGWPRFLARLATAVPDAHGPWAPG